MKFSPPLTVYLQMLEFKSMCPTTPKEWKQYISNVFDQILKESCKHTEFWIRDTAYAFIASIPERFSHIREPLIHFLPL